MILKSIVLLITFISIKCSIIVKSPKELVDKFPNATIPATLSNFGRIPYGHTTVGKVFYDPMNLDRDMACKPITSIDIGSDFKVDESPIIMINRGNCTFVKKVKNVEDMGGHVALIVNNVPGSIDYIVMADDGNGRDISIPALLITYEDGKILQDYYTKYKDDKKKLDQLILEINFEMEHPNNTVTYDLYFTSDNELTYKLLMELYFYHRHLHSQTKLNVHYITYQHPFYDPDREDNIPQPNCLGNGKYCNSPGKFGVTDGREVVKENIKQKCVYKYAYSDGHDTNLYWEYMANFYNKCLNQTEPKFNQGCSAAISDDEYRAYVNQCINDSYDTTDEIKKIQNFEISVPNSLLEKDNEDRRTFSLSFIPSLVINGRSFWGSWRADNVFEAICAGFKKKPEICYSEGAFERPEGISWFAIIVIVILIIAVNVVIFILCKKYIQRRIVERIESTDINHKINTVVTSYLALRDTK